MNLQKVRAVLFDLDGTLLDTVKDIRICLNKTLRSFGYSEVSLTDAKRLICAGVRNIIKGALPEGSSDEQIEAVLAVYQPIYTDNCAVQTEAYPGATELLRHLTANGYLVGMITNKSEYQAEYLMHHYFPETDFVIIWGNNGTRPLKPSPESGRLACETLGLQPEEILFVGDGDTDNKFAVNNGFVSCGVSWGYRDPSLLRQLGAGFIVDHLTEIGERLDAARGKE